MAAVLFGDIGDLKRQPVAGGFPQPVQRQMEQSMPATSKKQFKFMQAVAHGGIKKAGLSPSRAAEYVSGQSSKGLPEKAASKAPRRHRVRYPKP